MIENGAGGGSMPRSESNGASNSSARPVWAAGAQPEATRQFAFMVLAPIELARLSALREQLGHVRDQTIAHMQGTPQPGALLPFWEVEGLHYARFVVTQLGDAFHLCFATDYDGPLGDPRCEERVAEPLHLAALKQKLGTALAQIFAHCQGAHGEGGLLDDLRRWKLPSATFFVGAPGRSVRQIRAEALLRREVETFIGARAWGNTAPDEVRRATLAFLRSHGYPDGIASFPAQPDLTANVKRLRIKTIAAAVGLSIVLTPVGALALAGILAARFRWLEKNDPQFQPKLDAITHEHMSEAAHDENLFLQNQLTHIVAIKPGPLRWLLIRAVFSALQVLATNQYNKGKLGDIPSIHFARWVLGPARSVIFFSNFDSSWQSYLGDFIDKASSGLTAVWSNTVGYPRTTWLTTAGSRDAGRFLAWTRAHQVASDVWYSAYPGLSIVNINANTELRRGLADQSIDATSWLLRLRNVDSKEIAAQQPNDEPAKDPNDRALKVPASKLPLHDIQGIILKGYGHRPEARYLLFAVDQATPQLRTWLSELDVTCVQEGETRRQHHVPDPLINIAFTHRGLRALGVDPVLCDGFSTAFVQGAEHPQRALVNGDVGDGAPEHWQWGGEQNPVHFVIMVFARENVERHVAALRGSLEQAVGPGVVHVVETLEGNMLPMRKEHFGFRDGIAQPAVRGSGDAVRSPGADKDPEHSIAAGEFLLGHRDGYGNVARLPQGGRGFTFGLHGSYMVLRQLEQDVPAFWRFCAARGHDNELSPVKVAAKMVGRWPNGAPITLAVDAPPDGRTINDANEFGYASNDNDDRYGGRCPFGAHIRRSNPRDWGLGSSVSESRGLSGLHRIVRRGRPYGPPLADTMEPEDLLANAARAPAASPARGLNFICFNANLERQFEFVQQQWCKNPKFAAQDGDADPLLGIHQPCTAIGIDEPGFTIQGNQQGFGSLRLLKLDPFVKVRGSAYFFMPSRSSLKLIGDCLAPAPGTPSYETTSPSEQDHIDRLVENIRLMLRDLYREGPYKRDAHPKAHGCVKAEFIPHPDRPRDLRHGLFAEGAPSRRAWVRFSSEYHNPRPDYVRDTRGLALKLLGVPGHKLIDGHETCQTHDFIFLSTPRFCASSLAEFDEFINAFVQKSVVSWMRSVRPMARVLRDVRRHTSPLETNYWSVVPALIGDVAVKYTVAPHSAERAAIPKPPTENYLRETMKKQLAAGAHDFDVFVQRFQDQQKTPIEDPSIEWRERDAPLELVATLRILQQDDFDHPERDTFGERLAFNPFRCLPDHRPLGAVSRARREVYRAISQFRRADHEGRVPPEPEDWANEASVPVEPLRDSAE